MLAVGVFSLTWTDENGNLQPEKMKFAGRMIHEGNIAVSADDAPYFEGVMFDMTDRCEGTCSMTKKEFLESVETWHETL